MPPKLTITPKRVALFLGGGTLFFLLAHLASHTAKQFGHERVFGLVRLFDMDCEGNLPTLYSTLLFFLAGALFFSLWRIGRGAFKSNWTWFVFGAAVVFLGMDESCQFHEYLSDPVTEKFEESGLETSGFFLASWVIPYGTAALVALMVFLPFIWRLAPAIRWRLLLAGGIFLSGAVGVEMVTSKYVEWTWYQNDYEFNKHTDLGYGLLVALEETLEMLGLVLLNFTLLLLLQLNHGGLCVVVPPGEDGEAA